MQHAIVMLFMVRGGINLPLMRIIHCLVALYYNNIYIIIAEVCEFNGKFFQVGDSFPAGDGCNTWYVVLIHT